MAIEVDPKQNTSGPLEDTADTATIDDESDAASSTDDTDADDFEPSDSETLFTTMWENF